MLLRLEDVEQTVAGDEAAADQMTPADRAARGEKRRSNQGSLPTHLLRLEIVVDIDDKSCPCCQGELHRMGEDKGERLDIVPAQFRVLVHCLPRMRGPRFAGAGAGPPDRRRPADRCPVAQVLVPNMPTIARPRSTLVRGSTWTGQRWRTGSGMLPDTCAHCTNAYN
jgi:hypothetical protein